MKLRGPTSPVTVNRYMRDALSYLHFVIIGLAVLGIRDGWMGWPAALILLVLDVGTVLVQIVTWDARWANRR